MPDKDLSEQKSPKSFFSKIWNAVQRFRIGLFVFFTELPLTLRWALLTLSSILFLSATASFIFDIVSTSTSTNKISNETIINQTSSRLNNLVAAVSSLRDTVSLDSTLSNQIARDVPSVSPFQIIYTLDSLKGNKFSDILPFAKTEKSAFLNGRGVAIYDPGKHLKAWVSTRLGTANFDSVFTYSSLLEKHSKAIFQDNEQIFSWLVAVRKTISKDGALLGYVTAKSMIGERLQLDGSEEYLATIFDDILSRSGKNIQFLFPPLKTDSASSINIYPITIDPTDSSSVVGFLKIDDAVHIQQSGLQKIILFIRDISFVIFILFLFWLGCWYISQRASESNSYRYKLYAVIKVLFLLILGRVLLLTTDSLSSIISQSLQDSQDFALLSGFGLLANPLQLFTTILFITTFFALLWIIVVPIQTQWKSASSIESPNNFSTSGWFLKIVVILCTVLLFPLANFLFVCVCNVLVTNGTYHYLGNRFAFTRGSFTLMEASFLLVGVSYFFISLLILLWILRSMIKLTASELSPTRSYIAHYILFGIITTLSAWFFSPNVFSIYPDIYWLILSVFLCLITIIIFSRDVALLKSGQKGPSFFYRIPRSGLALLFLLTGAGFILSPVIAVQEYSNDIEIVKENLKQNSQVNDLNYSSFLEQTFLTFNSESIPHNYSANETSSDIKNLAFNIWLKQFPESSNRNVVIQIQDIRGKVLSHFVKNATIDDELKLKKIRDSLLYSLGATYLRINSAIKEPHYVIASEPCFTSSCTPASIGVAMLDVSDFRNNSAQRVDSLSERKLILSIAVWNDLFPQAATHNLYDIVRASATSTDKSSWQDQDVFYAQYQNSTLQNSSTTLIELPIHISSQIDTLLKTKEFISNDETIEGRRSFTLYHTIGVQGSSGNRVISASINVPGINTLLELTLSLNTVSLFIGFFLIFLGLLLRSVFSKGKRSTLKFRDRIFLIVLTIALVPLVIVTNITRTLLVEREQRIEHEHLQRDAEIISERLERTLTKSDSGSINTNLTSIINDLAHTIGRDISFFNDRGILTATNRPELYESSLLPIELSSQTIRTMFSRQKSFSIEPLASASGSFDVGYKAVQHHGTDALIGIVGVTSFRGMEIIEANIARTIELMYGAFAALGIILLLIGAWISVRVAAPLQQLIAATERVTEGQLETIVNIKRKDEVGELAQAFNRMTGELERTRENVAQSEREGAWKEMARQVAHEIKNPLTPMKLSVQHVEHAYESGDTNFGSVFKRVIRTLSEQIDVLTRIATEFSRFGEMPRRKYGFVSLRKIIESAMALYDAERVRIRFVVDIPNDLPPMYADDEEFRRALVNLIRNAIQATEGWGVILISARERNGLIHLNISDTGGGMSSETLNKAFDPNFSTKTSGMGLGLAIVKKIITDMSGTISVESTLGKGTTFHIELPAREYPNE